MNRDKIIDSRAIDKWFFLAASYNYDPKIKNEVERLKLISLSDYFAATFDKSIQELWQSIKAKVIERNLNYHFKNDAEKKKVSNQFLDNCLAEFMGLTSLGIFEQNREKYLNNWN